MTLTFREAYHSATAPFYFDYQIQADYASNL
jgi:hypothetical protein